MTYEEHVQLRNDLYQTSLKLFHSDAEWFSEYIPSVSKWRVKVMLRERFRNLANEGDPNSVNNVSVRERSSSNNNPTSSFISEDNSASLKNSEETPKSMNLRQSFLDTIEPSTNKDEISIKLPPSPSQDSAESSHSPHTTNNMWGLHDKSDSSTHNYKNACKINVDNSDELPVYDNKFHVDKKNIGDLKLSESVQNEADGGVNLRIDIGEKESRRDDDRIYNILTGKKEREFRERVGGISSCGLTLWEYLPLVAILSGCTGIFIIFRLSSAMYRFSVLSCIISHLVTFMLIGIPLSQLEFSMRKKGQRYGLLEAMQHFNPKYVGIVMLSLVTVVVIFLYSLEIISALSVILYNVPKQLWRVTMEDTLICSRINSSILPSDGTLIDFIKSGNLTAESLNYSFSLCSLSSMCNVVIPFFQDPGEIMNVVGSYSNLTLPATSTRNLGDGDFEVFMKLLQNPFRAAEDDVSSSPHRPPTWCIPSPSKKLRNLLVMQQSGYQEAIYFPLNGALHNMENLIKTQIFPMKRPLSWFNANLYAQICGLSIAFLFIIFSINGGGKIFRIASFLSFLSLITLFLTASIQIVASDIQLNIFISIVVTQDGIENLLSPAIWYCSINNTLLFFGISFLITMFPLNELMVGGNASNASSSLSHPDNSGLCDQITCPDTNSMSDLAKISSPSPFPLYDMGKEHDERGGGEGVSMGGIRETRIGEITLRKHVSRMYKSVCNQDMESSESKCRDKLGSLYGAASKAQEAGGLRAEQTRSNPRQDETFESLQNAHEEHNAFPSLMSAANSAMFFLACVIISSMVVLISNAALISLSESPNTPLLLPYNEKFNNATNTNAIKGTTIQNRVNKSLERAFNIDVNASDYSQEAASKGLEYSTTSSMFHGNNWLIHNMFVPDSGHFQQIFQFFNGESPSVEEISFLNRHMLNWFKWNFLQIKSQSLLLGEYMIIYLLIIAIEVSKRIPSGVIVFFILVMLSFAVSSACLCTGIISKHIFVILNYWIFPIFFPRAGDSGQDLSQSGKSKEKEGVGRIPRLKRSRDSKQLAPMDSLNFRQKLEKMERREKRRTKNKQFPLVYKVRCFFKLISCILSSFCLLLKVEVLRFFGISYWNIQNGKRRGKTITFMVQFAFITLLIVLVLLINVASDFIPRFPLDHMDIHNKVLKEKLELSKTALLNFSDENKLSKHHDGDIYVAKTFTIVFGSLLDIQIISNSANFMLALTAGIETVILTWYMYRDVQEQVIGRTALKLQAIGYIISTILLSVGFLLGTRFIFVVFLLLALLTCLIFFIFARYFAKKNFAIKHEQVTKRQKYSPTWWLYVSNIDILRRKLNSQELEDAGSLTYCSEKPTIQVVGGRHYTDGDQGSISSPQSLGSRKEAVLQRRYSAKNEELIQSISNFNLYCNVRSRQPLFISFWFILAKYFSSILIFSTIPLNIANTLSMLFLRLDCLDGIVSEIFLLNYITNMKVTTINILNRVSIFQPVQVLVVSLLSLFGIITALLITLYIKHKQDRLKTSSHRSREDHAGGYSPRAEEFQEISLNNILDDVYESLKVPKCAELYSNKKVENLGKMPQKLIISLAMLENH